MPDTPPNPDQPAVDGVPTTEDAARLARRLVHPEDPVWRSSILFSVIAHVLLFVVPLIAVRGCKDSVDIPGGGGGGGGGGGDGNPGKAVEVIKIAKKKQPERKRKQFGRTNSAISFFVPNIDDSTVATDLAETTENTYQANAGGFAGEGEGGFGKGPGSGGGFAGGTGDGPYRFIRIQYDDPQWNDGMGSDTRADMNFMDFFRVNGKVKVADHSESIPVAGLKNYNPGKAPYFIYFTGINGAINMPPEDVKAFRQYLQDGGMLIADAGSAEWGRAFRSFITKVLPDRELLDISNDDPIFSQPYRFPNGAPPLWHHDGNRARGVKIDGRWAVFYFPGNLNDAWKTGRGGQPPAIVTQSMRLGMNLVWYSAVHYLEATKQYRK